MSFLNDPAWVRCYEFEEDKEIQGLLDSIKGLDIDEINASIALQRTSSLKKASSKRMKDTASAYSSSDEKAAAPMNSAIGIHSFRIAPSLSLSRLVSDIHSAVLEHGRNCYSLFIIHLRFRGCPKL